MTDETPAYDVVEMRLDGVLLAEAPLPADVEAGPDSAAADEPILGATPAETPDSSPAEDVSNETPQERYRRLIAEGRFKPSELTCITNARGKLVEVRTP